MKQPLAKITGLAGCWLLTLAFSTAHAESDLGPENVTRSPLVTFRIEQQSGKTWIIPTAEPDKRMAIGGTSDMGPFFISPDERWICAKLHFYSQLDGVMLYRRKADFQFELVTTDECEMGDHLPDWDFDSGDRFVDTSDREDTAGVHDYFVCWSADSARLLVEKRTPGRNATGERIVSRDFFYFNLRRGKLEHTKYLRTLSRTFRSEEAESTLCQGLPNLSIHCSRRRKFSPGMKRPNADSTKAFQQSSNCRLHKKKNVNVGTTSASGSRVVTLAPRHSPHLDPKRNAGAGNCNTWPMPRRIALET
jgi:hypothetical protein